MSTQGLKSIKHLPGLDEIKVTPELKAKLQRRIAEAEQAPPRVKPRTSMRPLGYTAAAAAVLAAALYAGAQQPPLPSAGQDAAPVPLPPAYEQSTGNTAVKVVTSGVTTGKLLDADVYFTIQNANGNAVPEALTSQSAAEAQPGRKIITNGEYGVRVENARAAVDRLQRETTAAGGYVAEATVTKESDGSWVGRVVLRIPADKAAATVQSLGQIGTVERERQWTQDVTDQFMDLEHRIAIQKEHEQRLRELAEKAATFDDWNKLATQINNTRVEIENLTGRLKLLANQVDYAILNIQVLQPAPGAATVSKSATTLGGQVVQAFLNSISQLGALGRQAVVGLAAVLPLVLILTPLGVWAVLRLRRRQGEG